MKDKNKKHKESTIGKIIYGFMLFAPLLAIGITCLVNTFNAEAKNESSIIYRYETNEVNNINDLKEGNIYTIDISNIANTFNTTKVLFRTSYVRYQYFNEGTYIYDIKVNYENNTEFRLNLLSDNTTIGFYYVVNPNYYYLLLNRTYIKNGLIDFVYEGGIGDIVNLEDISKCENIDIERVEQKNLNNVFYDSITAVENNSLFNWSKNSIIYTGLQATCETLSITNTFIPMLMSYWLIMSVLYFLYDIVLMMLNVLHRKIHELQDSI